MRLGLGEPGQVSQGSIRIRRETGEEDLEVAQQALDGRRIGAVVVGDPQLELALTLSRRPGGLGIAASDSGRSVRSAKTTSRISIPIGPSLAAVSKGNFSKATRLRKSGSPAGTSLQRWMSRRDVCS